MTQVSPLAIPFLTVYVVVLYRLVFYSKGRALKFRYSVYQWRVSVLKLVVAVNRLVASEILDP